MGRSFYFTGYQDQWADHADKVKREGVVREGADDLPDSVQSVGDRRRIYKKDSAVGIDSLDAHMGGDRVVVEAEIPDRHTGNITQVVHRYSDSGKFLGSHEVTWEKTGNGRHTLARNRRIFY